ncbi:hypothetical protein HC928_16030, partial [bacterium]|nr:hypothetical protein [bacterium]
YGLPDLDATLALLEELGAKGCAYPGGQVELWLGMMLVKHYLLLYHPNLDWEEMLDAYYIERLTRIGRRESAYRHLVLAAPQAHAAWLAAADAVLSHAVQSPPNLAPESMTAQRAVQQQLAWLGQQQREQSAYIETLEDIIQLKNQHIVEVERLVQRLANGRVMRLLGWFTRRIS